MNKNEIKAIFFGIVVFLLQLFFVGSENSEESLNRADIYLKAYTYHPLQILAFLFAGAYIGLMMWFIKLFGEKKILANYNPYVRSFVIFIFLIFIVYSSISLLDFVIIVN